MPRAAAASKVAGRIADHDGVGGARRRIGSSASRSMPGPGLRRAVAAHGGSVQAKRASSRPPAARERAGFERRGDGVEVGLRSSGSRPDPGLVADDRDGVAARVEPLPRPRRRRAACDQFGRGI